MPKSIGPYKVAAALRFAGYRVLVIDHLHLFSLTELTRILQQAVGPDTLYVGFSTFFYQKVSAVKTIVDGAAHEQGGTRYTQRDLGGYLPHGIEFNNVIKSTILAANPQCKLVLGGVDAQDSYYIKDFDFAVLGYADQSAVNLAHHLRNGEALRSARRSIFGPTIIDDRQASGYDFVHTPMHYASTDIILPGETLVIEISRGCIFKCAFCSYPLNGKRKNDFIKDEAVLRAEFVRNYEQYGVTRYLFSDDTFNDSVEKIQMLHRISKSLPFRLEYWAYIRLDLFAAHPETIDLAVESGLRGCVFGIETMHPRTAAIIGKGGDRNNLVNTVNQIKQRYGDRVMLYSSFIFGLPDESIESMQRTAEQLLCKEILLDGWNIRPLYLREGNQVFSSRLDSDYEKYGYRKISAEISGIGSAELERLLNSTSIINWENNLTNFVECAKLAERVTEQGAVDGRRSIGPAESFYIAGLGFDLEYSANKPIATFDWHSVDLRKQERAKEYKSLFYKAIGLTQL